jgi:membrane-associated phospholipid phosphatase
MTSKLPTTFFVENRLLLWSHLALLGLVFLWFFPLTHPFCQKIDQTTFYTLNGSLVSNVWWQRFWGILNHRREVILNLILAAILNILAIAVTTKSEQRKIRIKQVFYFWIFFEIGFMLQDGIFNHWLQIARDSPSLVLQPVARLSALLNNPSIKDTSAHSFPGGHAFALVYWASFTFLCAPKKIAIPGIIISFILCSARLFSGAHWLSDVLFASLLALVWLGWTLQTPIYRRCCKPT